MDPQCKKKAQRSNWCRKELGLSAIMNYECLLWESQRRALHYGSAQTRIQMSVQGHSLVPSLIHLHCSLICLLRTARFTRALRFAYLFARFTPELVGQWTKRCWGIRPLWIWAIGPCSSSPPPSLLRILDRLVSDSIKAVSCLFWQSKPRKKKQTPLNGGHCKRSCTHSHRCMDEQTVTWTADCCLLLLLLLLWLLLLCWFPNVTLTHFNRSRRK